MEPASERRCVLLLPRGSSAAWTPLFGLTPVERTVLAFLRAGVRHFLIVGELPEAAHAKQVLGRGRCRGARVRAVASLPAALGANELFFLARIDCHYDRRLIARFVESTREACGTVLAVDFRARLREAHPTLPHVAVWPGSTPGALRAVGRHLVGADGVFVGLALGTPALARQLASPSGEEEVWLSGLAALARREPVETWSVREPWHPVRGPDDVPAARRQVLAGAVGIGDGPIARYLNRRVSLRITSRLLARDVKPWQVSVSSFALTLFAGVAFAVGHAATGGLLAQASSVLDGVDGELARVRYQDSPFGGLYDALLDRVSDAALIGGMTWYAWLMGAGSAVVALGFFAVAGSSLSMLVKEKYGTQFQRPWAEEREGRLRWLLLGRDGRLFLVLIAGLTGQVEAVLAYLAVGTHLHAGARIARIRAEASQA